MNLKIFYLKHTTSTYALTNFIHICIYNYQHVGIWCMVNRYRFKLEYVSTLQPLKWNSHWYQYGVCMFGIAGPTSNSRDFFCILELLCQNCIVETLHSFYIIVSCKYNVTCMRLCRAIWLTVTSEVRPYNIGSITAGQINKSNTSCVHIRLPVKRKWEQYIVCVYRAFTQPWIDEIQCIFLEISDTLSQW